MAEITIEDAFWPCCGKQFRDKVELVNHQLSDLEAHRDQITKRVHQHARMWVILKHDGGALEMRRALDSGVADWWNETKK